MTEQQWLEAFVRDHRGIAGTVHRRSGPDELALAAAVNIPEPVRQIVERVPRGKGMAGLALEHAEPISSCNIQEDRSGRVRPGARAVNARAGVALPVRDAAGEVRAVVGIAFPDEKTLTGDELEALIAGAATLP